MFFPKILQILCVLHPTQLLCSGGYRNRDEIYIHTYIYMCVCVCVSTTTGPTITKPTTGTIETAATIGLTEVEYDIMSNHKITISPIVIG